MRIPSNKMNCEILPYDEQWLERIEANKESKEAMLSIINKIYQEGFEDGVNNGQ